LPQISSLHYELIEEACPLSTTPRFFCLRTVKKLQSAALLLDLAWPRREGGGDTRSAVADALHRPAGCLRQAVSLRSAVPPEQRRSKPKRHATLWARARKAVWPRCPFGYSPLRGCALACALPYGLSCSRAALSNFFTGSYKKAASAEGPRGPSSRARFLAWYESFG
jgi:hypothetical protein